ncbi:MAG TPA: GNAT family N-acetyltransferase [Thermoplasmata archaeon]|nr:GNAT family N-acetyltransferase [Thermoplasmata archaeon]
MALDVRVRQAKVRDLPVLTRLWRELVGFHEALGGQDFRLAPGAEAGWKKYLRGHLGKSDRLCLVAEAGDQAVGFLVAGIERQPGIFMERDYGHISDVYVQEPQRGKGVGKALVAEALRWFEEKRVVRVRLQTDARNTLGFEFWKKLGFQTTVFTMDKLM